MGKVALEFWGFPKRTAIGWRVFFGVISRMNEKQRGALEDDHLLKQAHLVHVQHSCKKHWHFKYSLAYALQKLRYVEVEFLRYTSRIAAVSHP